MRELSERKMVVRQEQREKRRQKRLLRARNRRCFWTLPFWSRVALESRRQELRRMW